jgi:hypothetical protein
MKNHMSILSTLTQQHTLKRTLLMHYGKQATIEDYGLNPCDFYLWGILKENCIETICNIHKNLKILGMKFQLLPCV